MNHGGVHGEPSRGTSHSKKYITSEKEQQNVNCSLENIMLTKVNFNDIILLNGQ
jgi:hypothetical protein